MKRKLVSILLACAISVSLAACGSSASSNDASDSNETTTETASEDSKSDTSSKDVPSEVTEDNIADFPVTDASEFTLENGHQVYLSSVNLGGWDYNEEIPSDACAITGYNGTDKVVVIPEEIDGKKVTYLSSTAFANNDTIEGVYIPDTVVAIGEDCFFLDKNLKVLRISNNLEKSFTKSFNSVKEITLPASYNYMPDAEYAASSMFENNTVYLEQGISEEFANWLENNSSQYFTVIKK